MINLTTESNHNSILSEQNLERPIRTGELSVEMPFIAIQPGIGNIMALLPWDLHLTPNQLL